MGLNSCCHRLYVAATKMATSVVVTCCVTVHDCRAYVVLVRLMRFTPSEEFFTQELLVCIYCCLGCTYRYMGNSLSFLNFSSKMGLVSAVMFETCSVLSLSSVEVPHIRFKFKDVRLNKPFILPIAFLLHLGCYSLVNRKGLQSNPWYL